MVCDDFFGEEGHVTGEADELYVVLIDQIFDIDSVVRRFGVKYLNWRFESLGSLLGSCIWFWCDDDCDFGGEFRVLSGSNNGGHV